MNQGAGHSYCEASTGSLPCWALNLKCTWQAHEEVSLTQTYRWGSGGSEITHSALQRSHDPHLEEMRFKCSPVQSPGLKQPLCPHQLPSRSSSDETDNTPWSFANIRDYDFSIFMYLYIYISISWTFKNESVKITLVLHPGKSSESWQSYGKRAAWPWASHTNSQPGFVICTIKIIITGLLGGSNKRIDV